MRSERGSLSPFVAVVALALVMVTGMVYDGGQVLAAQARARDIAGNAARAGAQELDLDALRADGIALLAGDRARAAAQAFLADAHVDGTVEVAAGHIVVTVRFVHQMRILPVPDRQIVASERARPVAGVDGSDEEGGP